MIEEGAVKTFRNENDAVEFKISVDLFLCGWEAYKLQSNQLK